MDAESLRDILMLAENRYIQCMTMYVSPIVRLAIKHKNRYAFVLSVLAFGLLPNFCTSSV
jgi:hypothetical protein